MRTWKNTKKRSIELQLSLCGTVVPTPTDAEPADTAEQWRGARHSSAAIITARQAVCETRTLAVSTPRNASTREQQQAHLVRNGQKRV
jgi:hypothetical protein